MAGMQASGAGLGRRKVTDRVMLAVFVGCMVAMLMSLMLVFGYTVARGITSIDLDFFIKEPRPLGEAGGGMGSAILGTLIMAGIASAIAVPSGLGIGIYLAEFGDNAMGAATRFLLDVLTGIPSIVIGLFV